MFMFCTSNLLKFRKSKVAVFLSNQLRFKKKFLKKKVEVIFYRVKFALKHYFYIFRRKIMIIINNHSERVELSSRVSF